MKIHQQVDLLDNILDSWRDALGKDFTAYRNHCYRVLNFCLAISGDLDDSESLKKISIAVAHHDLGIWVNNTFDYLQPSKQLAREYLSKTDQSSWAEEIEAMIDQHHKIRNYKTNSEWLVEPFRKADWLDVSKSLLKFGLASNYVAEVMLIFPNAGFHKRLIKLTINRVRTNPFSPFPMMKL